MGFKTALLFATGLLCLAGCAQPQASRPAYSSREEDPMYQDIKRAVDEQMACFKREVLSKSVQNVDIETAALAVQGRCAAETLHFKATSAKYTLRNVPEFEARMRVQEAEDLQYIRQALALVRTSPTQSPARK
jgi:hypothetical protein